MWKGMSQEDVLLRLKREYPLPDGIGLNPESLIRLLKVLERVAPEEQFIKTVKLITRMFERKTDECLKNGYAYAVACGDYVSAQKCLYLLRNKCDLLPLHNIRPEDSSCLVSDGSKIDALSSTVPQSSVATSQISAVDDRERSVRNRLLANCSNEPSEHNSFRQPLETNNRTEKQVRGRKHKFSEHRMQSRQNESESDVSPKRSRNNSKQSIATRERDRGTSNINRYSYSDDEKSHSKRRRSKTKADDYRSKDDVTRNRSTRRLREASHKSQSTHDLSISPSPANHRIGKTQLKNNGKRDVHSDSDVLDYSSKRKPALKNKKVVDSGRFTQLKLKPRHHIHSSESESDYSNVRDDSHKQSSFSRRNICYDRHGKKVRRETSEESESECLFRPSNRKRPLMLEQGILRTGKHNSKYSRADTHDESSPEHSPEKVRRLNTHKSVSDSDSDCNLRRNSGNNNKTKHKGERNMKKTSREISSESNSNSDDSHPIKNPIKCKAKHYAETDSEVDTVTSCPIKRKQRAKYSDSEQLSNKASKPKRSKSSHNLCTSSNKRKSTENIKIKSKRDVHSDTDLPLDNSSKKKTANKNTKKLLATQEKAPTKNEKKKTPKQESIQKKTTCKSGKENTIKNASKKKPTNVEEMSNSKANDKQYNTPDPLIQKKGKNYKKSATSKTSNSSAKGRKSPSVNRKKPPTKSTNKNNSKSTNASKPNANISEKTAKPASKRKKGDNTKDTVQKKIEKSPVERTDDNVKSKTQRAVRKKTEEKKPVNKGKGKTVKEPEVQTDEVDKEDKSGLSLLASDHSFMSDSELDFPVGSLSTCLNSIKRQMPRPLGSATPPLSIFLRANSEVMADIGSDISSLDRVPVKLDDKNIVKRMAKANRPDNVEVHPSISKQNTKLNNTPEALRKIVNIKKKLEEKQTSDIECSSFSD